MCRVIPMIFQSIEQMPLPYLPLVQSEKCPAKGDVMDRAVII